MDIWDLSASIIVIISKIGLNNVKRSCSLSQNTSLKTDAFTSSEMSLASVSTANCCSSFLFFSKLSKQMTLEALWTQSNKTSIVLNYSCLWSKTGIFPTRCRSLEVQSGFRTRHITTAAVACRNTTHRSNLHVIVTCYSFLFCPNCNYCWEFKILKKEIIFLINFK